MFLREEVFFGRIEENQVLLSPIGKIVEECWNDIPRHFPATGLDQFVVMPNHVHGILSIQGFRRGEACLAPTADKKPQAKLSHVICSFKSAVSRRVNGLDGIKVDSIWQQNYYEHVIRDDDDLNKIREYITNNPLQWALDEENPEFVSGKNKK